MKQEWRIYRIYRNFNFENVDFVCLPNRYKTVLGQWRANVVDGGPTMIQQWRNISRPHAFLFGGTY